MSFSKILENVIRFVRLFCQANSADVKEWSTESIDNIFRWAEYCEKLYMDVQKKHWKKDLDCKVREINRLPLPMGNTVVCLEFLSTVKTAVFEALISNPHLPVLCFERCVQSGPVETDCLTKILCRHVQQLNTMHLQSTTQEEVYSRGGQLLCTHLTQRVKAVRDTKRRQLYVSGLLRLMLRTEQRQQVQNLLLACLAVLDQSTAEHDLIRDALLSSLQESSVLGCESSLLVRSSERYFPLWSTWIKQLCDAEQLCPELDQRTLLRHIRALMTSSVCEMREASLALLQQTAARSVLFTRLLLAAQPPSTRANTASD